MLRKLALCGFLCFALASLASAQAVRQFTFH